MKKIFRTFVVTLSCVCIGIIVAGYFYLHNNPHKLQQFVGCNAMNNDQEDFNTQLTEAINKLQKNDATILQKLEKMEQKEPLKENVSNAFLDIIENTTEEKTTNTTEEETIE